MSYLNCGHWTKRKFYGLEQKKDGEREREDSSGRREKREPVRER